MKLATIRDLATERNRLEREIHAGRTYLNTKPLASDADMALYSINELEIRMWHLEKVIEDWEAIAENEAVRSPLLDDDGGGS